MLRRQMTQEKQKPSAAWHAVVFIAIVMALAMMHVRAMELWPIFWIAPLAIYLLVVWLVPFLRTTFRPWRFGLVSKFLIASSLVIAVASCAILAVFHWYCHPDVSLLRQSIPVDALRGILCAGILFSIGNALLEEIVFRGVIFDAASAFAGDGMAVFLSAALFGMCHLQGYPPGALGGVLAGVFGLCLGWLRMMTGGLGLAVLVHITADATIYSLIFSQE